MPQDDRTIAISATFTAEPIQAPLAFWMDVLGLGYEVRFAAYNQVFQELLDPAGLFARNAGGVNVVLVRLQDWPSGGWAELVTAVGKSPAAAPLIVVVCPGRSTSSQRPGAADLPHVVWPEDVAALYPVEVVHDEHGDELGHLPYTPEYFAALATAIARKVHALRAAPFKVIALDCDNTLWSGICGEDGPHGVVVDPPRCALQEFMAARRSEGMLLALCSKNNEEDVAETFRAHADMPLKLADMATTRINWGSKSANLEEIARELDLGLDSVILVDDNPLEVDEARAGAPESLALALPAKAEEIAGFLRHVWAFDRAKVTEEDRNRAGMYAQRAERARAERGAANLEEFLAGLKLEVRIAPMESAQVERVAQLTQRTNQMNTTCLRRTAAEVSRLGAECLTVTVSDRFGGYGLTGVMIFRAGPGKLAVDTFLLSCRALGRGVEHRMVARLGEIARERGLDAVEIPFVAGQRNRPAQLFLESIAPRGAGGVFRLSAVDAARLVYRPPSGAPVEFPRSEGRDRATVKRADYERIATRLRTPAQVMEAMRAQAPKTERVSDPPRTALERDLAELWGELLNVSGVGAHDNFFELGGHSLLAVQLLSRVHRIYGVELSLEVVYSGEFTVAELAKAIELKEIEQSGGDYQELLRELDGLSDEEVRALLAEEQDAN
jgi:FkbH-like protein